MCHVRWHPQQHTKQRGLSTADLLLYYKRANMDVARLCNHQRSLPKTHDTAMQNIKRKVFAL